MAKPGLEKTPVTFNQQSLQIGRVEMGVAGLVPALRLPGFSPPLHSLAHLASMVQSRDPQSPPQTGTGLWPARNQTS